MATSHSSLRFAKYSEGTCCPFHLQECCHSAAKLMALPWARFRILYNIGKIFQVLEPSHGMEHTLPSLCLSQSGQNHNRHLHKSWGQTGNCSHCQGTSQFPTHRHSFCPQHLPISSSNLLMITGAECGPYQSFAHTNAASFPGA